MKGKWDGWMKGGWDEWKVDGMDEMPQWKKTWQEDKWEGKIDEKKERWVNEKKVSVETKCRNGVW